ncbi:phosphopantetheine-binding protein, partial [Paraburkholderia agricolaris]
SPMGTRLIAYVSANANTALAASSLRQALAEALPEHMVPSAIVVLDTLPLSPNGKVDRKALPAPEQGAIADRAATYEPPQNPTERAIVAIWQDILGIERIGRHDNFFELGGHSLLTMKAQRAIFRDLQTDIPLASLFLKPTLHEIAAECEALHANAQREQDDNVREMKSLLDELMD